MSYRCDGCGEHKSGEEASPNMHVSVYRKKVYRERERSSKRDVLWDNGGQGLEIAKEQKLCNLCLFRAPSPVVVP